MLVDVAALKSAPPSHYCEFCLAYLPPQLVCEGSSRGYPNTTVLRASPPQKNMGAFHS